AEVFVLLNISEEKIALLLGRIGYAIYGLGYKGDFRSVFGNIDQVVAIDTIAVEIGAVSVRETSLRLTIVEYRNGGSQVFEIFLTIRYHRVEAVRHDIIGIAQLREIGAIILTGTGKGTEGLV